MPLKINNISGDLPTEVLATDVTDKLIKRRAACGLGLCRGLSADAGLYFDGICILSFIDIWMALSGKVNFVFY